MKHHLKKALLFVFLLVVLDRGIHAIFSSLAVARTEAGGFNLLYSGKADFDIVFFGSSRTYLHIDPRQIDAVTGVRSHNFGLEATNFDQHLFTAEEYLIQNRQPRILVFEADLQSLDKRRLKFLHYIFPRYAGKSEHTYRLVYGQEKPVTGYYLEWAKGNLLKSLAFSGRIPDLIAGALRAEELETEDYIRVGGAFLKKKSYALDSAPKLIQDAGEISEERSLALGRFLEDCRRRGIKTVLLMSPYYNADRFVDRESHQRVSSEFQKIARDTGSVFIDFSFDPELIHEPSFFYNFNHLSERGAGAFSRLVGLRLKAILDN